MKRLALTFTLTLFALVATLLLQMGSARADDSVSILNHCSGCNLSNVDWHGRNLSGVHLSGADLRHANLRGADLRNARFSGVDFADVDLRNADLRGARFAGCDFNGAPEEAMAYRGV